jgi:hypothetical protein
MIFSLSSVSRPALRPTQPSVHWVPRVLSQGVKRGRGVTLTIHPHLVPRSWIRVSRSYTSSPSCTSIGVLWDCFTFYRSRRKFHSSLTSIFNKLSCPFLHRVLPGRDTKQITICNTIRHHNPNFYCRKNLISHISEHSLCFILIYVVWATYYTASNDKNIRNSVYKRR